MLYRKLLNVLSQCSITEVHRNRTLDQATLQINMQMSPRQRSYIFFFSSFFFSLVRGMNKNKREYQQWTPTRIDSPLHAVPTNKLMVILDL